MPRAKHTQLAESVAIRIDGVELWTDYDAAKRVHSVVCDKCGRRVDAGPNGNDQRIGAHRNGRDCYQNQLVQAREQGKPVPPLPDAARTSTAPSRLCFGAPYRWTVGSIWDTYPYHSHNNADIGWIPFTFDPPRETIYFRADDCESTISGPAQSCRPCERVVNSTPFKKMQQRAVDAQRNARYDSLTYRQLSAVARQHAADKKRLRSKLLAAKQSRRRWKRRAEEYEQLVFFLSKRDVPRLRWVLAAALKRGTTPTRLLSILIKAADNAYRAHGYSQRELDIACLAVELGGPRLLYALGRSHGFLSKRTIRRHLLVPRLLPSIAVPTKSEIDTNLSSFLDPDVSPAPLPLDSNVSTELPGHILLLDGVAVDARAGYCFRRDEVIGLSRETAPRISTSASSRENIEAIRLALQDQRVRFGSEATVVAVAPYADTEHYSPIPIALSPSDKSEDAVCLLDWLQTALRCWKEHPNAQASRGPIWSIATDGDATFRKAKHLLCTAGELDSTSPLWSQLSTLKGFNRRVSADAQTTWTCDPKHIIKRFATLLRSPQGIMFFGANIRPNDILFHLTTHLSISNETAVQLLDPADKQNVPKAVSLMQRLDEIASASPSSAALAPNEAVRQHHIDCFSDVLAFFVKPFICVKMSLTEQLESLAAFSHAVSIIQLKHGSACLTGALYADTQATIKNIYFVVARLKRINPNYRFYLMLEGTDRLEIVFSETRTMDHARNFDTLQLSGKLSSAFLVHAIFQRNPDLDRGHRRLDMANVMGIDHLNPKSWEGDVCVDKVDLSAAWARGREKAVALLGAKFGASALEAAERLTQAFSTPDCDVLRPEGHYVGVSGLTPDDDRSERVELAVAPRISPEAPSAAPAADDSDSDNESDRYAEGSSPAAASADSQSENLLPAGLDFDDLFPDTLSGPNDTSVPVLSETPAGNPEQPFSKTFDDGKGGKIWKSALIATLSADRSRTVTVRTLRAQGITLEDLRQKSKLRRFDDVALPTDDVVKTGDLMGFLTRINKSFALAVLEISEFCMPNGTKRLSMTTDEFEASTRDPKTKVLGQVLQLSESKDVPDCWVWNREYISLDGDSDARITHTRFLLEVPTSFLHPLAPELVEQAEAPGQAKDAPPLLTWSLSTSQLEETLADAWESLEPNSDDILMNMHALPTLKNTQVLPYRSVNDQPCFVVRDIPERLAPEPKHDADRKLPCHVCGKFVVLAKMRDHVGTHILRAFRDVDDPLLDDGQVVPDSPCGFCGREGCTTVLAYKKKKKAPVIHSSCGYHYESMSYAAATKSTNSSKSTNVPIQCVLCPVSKSGHHPTIWKYNAAVHFAAEHSGESHERQLELSMFVAMHITRAEEESLLIPADRTTEFRQQYHLPDSDAVQAHQQEMAKHQLPKVTRSRAETTESEKAAQPPTQRQRVNEE